MLFSCWVFYGGGGGGVNQQPELEPGLKYMCSRMSILFPRVGGFLEIFYHTAIEYLKFPYKFKDSNKISIPL